MAKYKVAVIGSTGRGDYGHGLDSVWKDFPDCEVVQYVQATPCTRSIIYTRG